MRNQCTKLCRHTQAPCVQNRERQTSPTTLLQDIPTFNGQDSLKLEDWFIDTETATGILTESHTSLTEAKSCDLTHTLICEAVQVGKCWDEIRGILRLKLYNVNIHTYTSCFMETQQRDNETVVAYIHHFKTTAKWCMFDNDKVNGLWDVHTTWS